MNLSYNFVPSVFYSRKRNSSLCSPVDSHIFITYVRKIIKARHLRKTPDVYLQLSLFILENLLIPVLYEFMRLYSQESFYCL